MKIQMKLKVVGAVVVTMGLIHSVSAQDYHWNGLGDGTSWSDGANWVELSPPPNGTVGIFIGTGFPTTSLLPITIGVADVVQLSGTLYGPEWGQTLNIYGNVTAGYGFAPLGANGGPKSTVNLYGNASFTAGDSIFVGDVWWFDGGPNLDINLYDNSQMTGNYLILGGHLNIYGGTVTVNNAFLTGTASAGQFGSSQSTDATRLVNLLGGQLVIAGDATALATDMISRGILEGYGTVGNVNVDTSSSPGFTIITAVPEPASVVLLGLGCAGLFFRRWRS